MRNPLIGESFSTQRPWLQGTLAAACLALGVQASHAESLLTGRVVAIADGDTITVLDADFSQYKARVAGIDAPEKGQPFGSSSKAHLSTLVMGRTVQVQWNKKDRYGRVVGVVTVNGSDAGLEQIRSGLAWHYKAYAKEQTREERISYAFAEEDARAHHRGLWRDPSPVPPWDYRSSKREARSQRY